MANDILEVNKKIQSGNQIIRNHWAVNRRNKQEWAILVRNQMRLRKIKKATIDDKYTLLIISYRKRKLDKDNLYTGCKSLIDACVEEGLIFGLDILLFEPPFICLVLSSNLSFCFWLYSLSFFM